jgi:hypothetical protein
MILLIVLIDRDFYRDFNRSPISILGMKRLTLSRSLDIKYLKSK